MSRISGRLQVFPAVNQFARATFTLPPVPVVVLFPAHRLRRLFLFYYYFFFLSHRATYTHTLVVIPFVSCSRLSSFRRLHVDHESTTSYSVLGQVAGYASPRARAPTSSSSSSLDTRDRATNSVEAGIIASRSEQQQQPATMSKLYVGNLPSDCNESALRQLFQEHSLACTTILVKRGGYAFVDCADQSTADRAIDKLNGEFFFFLINDERINHSR